MSRTILKKLSAALLFAAIALLPSTAAMQQKGGEEEGSADMGAGSLCHTGSAASLEAIRAAALTTYKI